MASTLQYSELTERAAKAIENFLPDDDAIAKRVQHFSHVQPRNPDKEGDVEMLDKVQFTHHFVKTAGDYEEVEWHYVTCGDKTGIPIVFLHGIPDSWYQWHHQMSAMASKNLCVAVDLKGYGQSTKAPGTYQHEAVADQLYILLQTILPAPKRWFFVTHDRGTVQADFICAKYPDSVTYLMG